MLSFLRAPHPPKTHQAGKDLTIYEHGASSVQYHPKGSKYIMTHILPPMNPKEGPSIVQPPFHYHIYQTEHFRVMRGTAHMFFGLDSAPTVVLRSQEGGQTSATLGPRRYHRFENASSTEELEIAIRLDPDDYENESRFFRNFFGYLDDCKRAKQAPSIFQLFVFLHSADTPLAIPMPLGLETVGVYLSWLLLIVVAYLGRFVLGCKTSYPEYYESDKSR